LVLLGDSRFAYYSIRKNPVTRNCNQKARWTRQKAIFIAPQAGAAFFIVADVSLMVPRTKGRDANVSRGESLARACFMRSYLVARCPPAGSLSNVSKFKLIGWVGENRQTALTVLNPQVPEKSSG
jgi:hypothetical protein